MEDNQFRCTGTWNGEEFDRVIEAESEADAMDHWLFWAWTVRASLENLQVNRVAN